MVTSMDFIGLAENIGIDRNAAITVYKRLNGGYFIKMYYSRIPMLYSLHDWPNLYLRVSKYYPLLAKPQYNEAFVLMVYLDVYSIYGMSAGVLNSEIPFNSIINEISFIFKNVENYANQNKIFPYPQDLSSINITKDFDNFVRDLINRRMQEINTNIEVVLNDLAYDSDLMSEIKAKYPWAKTITRDKALRAISLAKKLDDFLIKYMDKMAFLVAGITKYFDELVITQGLYSAITKINEEYKALQEGKVKEESIASSSFYSRLMEIINKVKNEGKYF